MQISPLVSPRRLVGLLAVWVMLHATVLAQAVDLEPGTYAGTYNATARTECEDGSEETFDAIDLLEALEFTLEITEVSNQVIVVDGREFNRGNEGRFFFVEPEAFDAEQNATFVNRYSFIINAPTAIQGTFRVNYQIEGDPPCSNFFRFTAERTGDAAAPSSDGNGGALETGTYNIQYGETATVQCGNDPEESFSSIDFFGEDLTDIAEVEAVTSNAIIIDGDEYTVDPDGSYAFAFPETYDSDRGLTVVNRLIVTITSSTSFEGALFADFVFDSDGILCIETYPFTAQKADSSDSNSASSTAIMLETGTFEGQLAATTDLECTDGYTETFDSIEVWEALDFDLEVESVGDGTLVILGDTFTQNADGTYSFTSDPFVEEDGFEFTESYVIEITSPTTIAGTYSFNYNADDDVPCTETTAFSVEKS